MLNAQETITIGSGEAEPSYYIPSQFWYKYSLTQQIYTSEQLGFGKGVISDIAFFRTDNYADRTRNYDVYMVNTSKASFTVGDWVTVTEADKVFSGSITFKGQSWNVIDIEDFEYYGENILICIDDNTGVDFSNTPFKENTTSDYTTLYYCNDNNNPSPASPPSQSSNCMKKNNQIMFTFTPSAPVGPSLTVSEESIALGDVRMGNYWTEKPVTATVEVAYENTDAPTVTSYNEFFTVSYDASSSPFNLTIGYNKNASVTEEQTGIITITSGELEKTITVTATAYTPAQGDVYENPITVNFDANNSFTAQATGMYDDYILPDEAEDGKAGDAVYKFTLANDAAVTANVNGTNAIAAIYKAEDLQGNGPSSDNNYNGIVSGPTTPTTFFYDFNDGDLSDFTLIDKDTETAGKYNHTNNWEIISAGGPDYSKCLISYSYKYSPSINNANNYVVTKEKYKITANSKLTFDAKNYGSNDPDYLKVEVSADGENFTYLTTVTPGMGSWLKVNVDLGVLLTEKGLQYGEYHIALHHEEYFHMYIYVDNLALTDGSAKSRAGENQIDGVQYPAGTYYLVAAAEGDFTLNLSTSSLPAPAEFAYTAPENNTIVEETNPELTWESSKYASSYDVYLGTTADALSIKAENITATSYQTTDLSNNTKYYWQVVAKNSAGEFEGGVYSFITPLDIPKNVTASSNEIYPNANNVTITWNAITGVKGYNVYVKVNGEGNAIKHNGNELVTTAETETTVSYELSNMDYSKNGHEVYVTAVYEIEEGKTYESNMSATQTIKVTDYVALSGTIKDGTNPIAGAKISLAGTDEFGTAQTYTFTSGENGAYDGKVLVGSYTITVSRFDYKTIETTIEFDGPGNSEFSISMESNPVAEFTVNAEEGRASWDAEYASYNVYRRSNGNVTSLATEVKAEEYQDAEWETLADGEYEYGVSAMVEGEEKDILNVGFEDGSIPSGWNNIVNNGRNWNVYSGSQYANSGSYYIYANTSYYSGYTLAFESSEIDLNNQKSPILKFYYKNSKQYNYSYYYNNTLTIKVKVEGETSWETVRTISDNVSTYTQCEILLNSYIDKKIQIRFECYTNAYAETYIDDIVISAKPISESRINWSAPVEKGGITFTGDGYWNDEANWSAVPNTEDKVTIKGNATITENVTVGSIRIASGATLTVKSGAVLNVTNGISNTNAAALVMEDGAQIIQTNSNVAATFNMNIVNPTQGWGKNKDGWQFIASPLLNAKTSAFETNGENNDFDMYKYDGTKEGAEWVNYKNHKRVGDTFEHNFNDGLLNGWTNLDATYQWNIATGGINSTYCLTSANSGTSYVMSPKVLVEKGSKFYFTAKSVYDQNIVVAVSETGSIDDMATKLTVSIGTSNWQWQDERYVSLDEYDGKEIYIVIKTTSVHNGWATMSIDNLRLENAGVASDGTYETEFVNGRAYLASYQAATTATFEGTLNNARAFSQELSYSGDEKPLANFHLLGNPFTFDMDMTKATYNNLVAGVAIVDGTGGYTYVGTGKEQTTIPVGDGFFVKATAEGASFKYNADSKRSRSTDVNSINIIASGKAGKDNVIVNFAGKSEGFDKLQNFNDEIATVYVAEGNKHYGIYNCDEDVQEIELAFEAKEMGSYTMAIEADGKFQSVTLVDRFTGIETNMLMEDYHFTATSGNNTKRFVVRLDNGQESTDNSQFVYQNGEELILTVEGAVQIVDVMGRVVYNNEVVSDNNRIDVSSFINGAYIVRVINEEGVKAQKVVIY